MRRPRVWMVCSVLAAAAVSGAQAVPARPAVEPTLSSTGDRVFRFFYRTHAGRRSYALLLLPAWYGRGYHPTIPIVICPHGRATAPESATMRWASLPTQGGFAVVLPAGYGRKLQLDSWGYPGQIDDLARMPTLAEKAVPFFHFDRVYAVGASMGGQEALLLLAKHPRLLAGVVAFDPAVDLADRYREFPFGANSWNAQAMARREVGGTPARVPRLYRARSPSAYAPQIAFSDVPLELWWSTADQVIVDQAQQAGSFYQLLKQLNPTAPITAYVGSWPHATEDSALAQLPTALTAIGLLPPAGSRQ